MRALFVKIGPTPYGISRGRWANVRSLVGLTMASVNAGSRPSRPRGQLSAQWKLLLPLVPFYPCQIGLGPFGRYCSSHGIEPDAVHQGTFDDYEQSLQVSARLKPRDAFLKTLRAWNKASEVCASWPKFRPIATNLRNDYSYPWSHFPSTFKAEVDKMVEDLTEPDPFDADSPKRLRKATALRHGHNVRALASALVRQGCAISEFRSLRYLIEPDRVKQALRWVLKRINKQRTTHLRNLANTTCVVACWVRTPDEVIRELKLIRRRTEPKQSGMTQKNRDTLRIFDNPEIVRAFLRIAPNTWAIHRPGKTLSVVKAVELQVALAIEILSGAPVRISNLASIRLGKNIVEHGSGPYRSVGLVF
ncbi:MAG: hypothetical protein JSS20_18375, partial [Proteobacteria bacterium]|nr:hypothetical protein [Pseudomonadota bacterium]